jgi:hypothetical protein
LSFHGFAFVPSPLAFAAEFAAAFAGFAFVAGFAFAFGVAIPALPLIDVAAKIR